MSSTIPAKRALAQIFHIPSGNGDGAIWHIQCECGYAANGASVEEAGSDFSEHMFFGEDTSAEHFRYGSGFGRRPKDWPLARWNTPRQGSRVETRRAAEPVTEEVLRAYLEGNAASLPTEYADLSASLIKLAGEAQAHMKDLKGLEKQLTELEEKMMAIARGGQTERQRLKSRQELDRQLRPYRGKMTADQLAILERQYFERNLLESMKLPRLSLFYMR